MNVDLNRLRIFSYIYLAKSITTTAEQLHITPSAVSQQLKKLETELKTPLFTRLHKRLIPTSAGSRLFQVTAPLIQELTQGISTMTQELSEPTGLLRIGAPMEFGSLYLPYVIATFRKNWTKVSFSIELGRPSTLLPKLNKGELDFAFIDTFPTKKQHYSDFGIFSIEPVIEEQVVLACSKTYFSNVLDGVCSFDKLKNSSFISQQPDARAINNWFLHHFNKEPGKLSIVLTVQSHQAIVSAIRHHLGLGIIVSHLVWDDIQSGTIKMLREENDQTVNRISIAQLQDKIPPLPEKLFLSHFKETTQKSKTLQRLKLTLKE